MPDVIRRLALDELVVMTRGTRGAYRKEDRVALPPELQRELVEKAAAKCGNCQELAKQLDIPKSSVHYYRIGRLTVPVSVLQKMLELSADAGLESKVRKLGVTKDRLWAIEHAKSVFIDMCREQVRLPSKNELRDNQDLRRDAARVVSYVLAEGSVWMQNRQCGEYAANITFADHETDLYRHFRSLCQRVFSYDIGPPQKPGNNSRAIRGFVYSRFVAEALIHLGVRPGDKASMESHLPKWVMDSDDKTTWIAALQPILDGEGSVSISFHQGLRGFSVSQSRHSNLDLDLLSPETSLRRSSRCINRGEIRSRYVFGIPVLDYLAMTARSGVLDDSAVLLLRLGLHPRVKLHSLYLKDDGFWSCNWTMYLPRYDTSKIIENNLVTQELKRYGLELFRD